MTKNKVKQEKKIDKSENKVLSTEGVLAEIGNAVTKEKLRREKSDKKSNLGIYELDPKMLVQPGESNFSVPMPKELATLKSLIQTIVRDELRRSLKR